MLVYDNQSKPSQGISMTGAPHLLQEYCCCWGHETGCDGVLIQVSFDTLLVFFCRRHLDLFADMIVHTRQLREADPDSEGIMESLQKFGMIPLMRPDA